MHARGPARAEPHDGRRVRCPHRDRTLRRTCLRRRRRRARVGQHRKHGRARTIRMALRTQILYCPRGVAPPQAGDRARAGPRCVVPAAWRSSGVCGCCGVHPLERHCACGRSDVVGAAARARRAGWRLSWCMSRRLVRASFFLSPLTGVRVRPFIDDDL